MLSIESWAPSKYIYRRSALAASRDCTEVSPGSRLVTDITAGYYDKNLKTYAVGRLLDLGCGKVPLYAAYKEYVSENTCVDWGSTLHKNEHLDFECDLTKPLPFKEAEYNTVILSDVLEHIPQPELLMSEISRVLSSGGVLFLNVPFFYWLHEEPHDFYRYTEFALRNLAESSGFDVISLSPTGGVPEILTDIYSKSILRIPLIGKCLAISAQWLTSLFIQTKFGRKVSKTTSARFPLGYFMIAKKNEISKIGSPSRR